MFPPRRNFAIWEIFQGFCKKMIYGQERRQYWNGSLSPISQFQQDINFIFVCSKIVLLTEMSVSQALVKISFIFTFFHIDQVKFKFVLVFKVSNGRQEEQFTHHNQNITPVEVCSLRLPYFSPSSPMRNASFLFLFYLIYICLIFAYLLFLLLFATQGVKHGTSMKQA